MKVLEPKYFVTSVVGQPIAYATNYHTAETVKYQNNVRNGKSECSGEGNGDAFTFGFR